MRAHSRQSPPGLWGSVWNSQIPPEFRCSKHEEGEGMRALNKEMVKLSHKGAQTVHRSRTHRYSTQPVACIRGYEPSGASYRVATHCRLIQATFQAQRQLWYSPTCVRYKDTVIVSFYDVKCKQNYIWRKIDTITESLTKTANRAKQNTVQDGSSSKSSHSSCWIQLVMRAHSRQSPYRVVRQRVK